MRSMAVLNADRRRRFTVLACAFLALAWLAVSRWDQEALEEMAAEAATSPQRASRWLTETKQRALMYAVEEAGHREYFASGLHCRAPIRGERLVMQHANPRDAGAGYRCTYWMTAGPELLPSTVTWSRSPETVMHFVHKTP